MRQASPLATGTTAGIANSAQLAVKFRAWIASGAALASVRRNIVKLQLGGLTPARREAILTVLAIMAAFALIIYFDLGTMVFASVEHRPDYKRDTLILAGLATSLGLLVFALRRWSEVAHEVTVRLAAEKRATALASEDALTGLPNRRALSAELTAAIGRAHRNDTALSLLLLDLDRFKPVNDLYGHVAGDRLLQEITRRLTSTVRDGEFVARLGGDEFAVAVAHSASDRGAPIAAAERIRAVLSLPASVGSAEVFVGVSAGVATFPCDADDVESLMRRADVALYRAKEKGRGRCELFDATMDAEIRERAAIEADLRQAIAADEVVPHYQPLIDLRSGRIVGFEALARWVHPVQGFIPPSSFIPIAEETGLVADLGLSMLRQGCRHARQWGSDMLLAINISPVQLTDLRLADKILAILAEAGLPPRRLEVEITENSLIGDLAVARDILSTLKLAGVSICLDDFGAGYSSLRHLTAMPFDRVKIDRAFVQGLHESGDSLRVVRAIVGLCTSLGLATTGEGAETSCHVSMLRAAGCSVVQGWYFGKAVDAMAAQLLASEGRVPLSKLHMTGADDAASAARISRVEG